MGWHAAAYGYDGFLRWAYDSWTADPSRDARHLLWPAGDCFLVYPGARSSIRFERLREGIVDFEKIRVLRELIDKRAVAGAGEQLREALGRFGYSRAQSEPAADALNAGKECLNSLTQRLFS